MAEYRPIKTKIWNDTWFLTLTPEEKLVWIFLLTNSFGHISGIYELPKTLISPLTGCSNWEEILAKFEKDGKIECKEGWIYIKNYLKNQTKQINKKDNIFKSITAYLNENPKITRLFKGAYKGLTSPYPKVVKIESSKVVKKKVVNAETADEVKKLFFENPLMEKIKQTYPDRDYELQFGLMIDWWKAKGRLPKNLSAFSNWLKNTQPDERVQAERRRQMDRDDLEKKRKMMEETPRLSDEKLQEMRDKMKNITKPM